MRWLTMKVRVSWHWPPLVSTVSAGPRMLNVSKSKRRVQTSS